MTSPNDFIKISQLPSANTINDADLLEIVQGGINKKVAASVLLQNTGASGFSGFSGVNGTNGVSGYSGFNGTNGTSGYSGSNGSNGASGFSGYSGISSSINGHTGSVAISGGNDISVSVVGSTITVAYAPGVAAVADSDYTIQTTDRMVALLSMTNPRQFILPLASSYPVNQILHIGDFTGSASPNYFIGIVPSGSDTLNGLNAALKLKDGWTNVQLQSDGVSKWIASDRATTASVINDEASSLRNFRTRLAMMSTGTIGNVKILCIGDSITAGEGASPPSLLRSNSYPSQLATTLTNLGIPASDNSMTGSLTGVPGNLSDPRISNSGSWQVSTVHTLGDAAYYWPSSGVMGTFSFTPPLAFDTVIITSIANSYGSFSVNVNGGSTLATVPGSGSDLITTTLRVPIQTGTVNITPSNDGSVYISAIQTYNSQNPVVSVYNAGWAGAHAADIADNSQPWSPLNGLTTIAPDLTTIMVDTNDIIANTNISSYITSMGQIISAAQSSGGDVIIMIAPPGQDGNYLVPSIQQPFLSAQYALAAANNCLLIDIDKRWISWGNSGNLYWDSLHPNAAGYADIAGCLARAILLYTGNGGSFVPSPYALDPVQSTVARAYGLHRLLSSYTGPLVNVRRSSDNATLDIYAQANGDLDSLTLSNFIGGDDGFVNILYEQNGTGYHASQNTTSLQPPIASSGTINTVNNRPILAYSTNVALSASDNNLPSGSSARSVIALYNGSLSGDNSVVFYGTLSTGEPFGILNNQAGSVFYIATLGPDCNSGFTNSEFSVYQADYTGTILETYQNNYPGATSTGSINTVLSGTLAIGNSGGTFTGSLGDIIIFNNQLTTTQRSAVSQTLGQYYGLAVYAPLAPSVNTNGIALISDANYNALPTDRMLCITSITTNRTFTLPSISSFPSNTILEVNDLTGALSYNVILKVNPHGSDYINGGSAPIIMADRWASIQFIHNGTAWTANVRPSFNSIIQNEATGLPHFRAQFAKMSAGLVGNVNVLCVGDSITAGYGANPAPYSNSKPLSYPSQLVSVLNGLGIPAIEGGEVGTNGIDGGGYYAPGWDSRISMTSAWSAGGVACLGNGGYFNTTATGNLSFTPSQPFDTALVTYVQNGFGSFTVNISGSTSTCTTVGGPALTTTTIKVPLQNSPITVVPSTGDIFLTAIRAYNSQSPHVSVLNAGAIGWTAAMVDDTSQVWAPINGILNVAPDLSIIMLNTNDISANTPITSYLTQMQNIINACKASGDVILVIAPPNGYGNYLTPSIMQPFLTANYLLARLNGMLLIDIDKRWLSQSYSSALYHDATHPNAAGYADVAGTIGRTISNYIGAGATYTPPSFALDVCAGHVSRAYGINRLLTSYTGPLINVTRSSDMSTMDIYSLPNGDLDVSTMLSFVGSSNGTIGIWYDQAATGNNAIQATVANQVPIVSSGAVILDPNGYRPSPLFSTSAFMTATDSGLPIGSTARSMIAIYNGSLAPGAVVSFYGTSSSGETFGILNNTGSTVCYAYGNSQDCASGFTSTAYNIYQIDYTGTAWATWMNNSAGNTSSATLNTVLDGTLSIGQAANSVSGNMSTIVYLNEDLTTSQRELVNQSLGRYFGIIVS